MNTHQDEVCEHDMKYLTIGIVVNAPYGKSSERILCRLRILLMWMEKNSLIKMN